MNLFARAYYFFTPYTDARERAVAKFFARLTERSNPKRTRARLLPLVQRDIAVINLWTEYRYKGYKYLTKSERKKLYKNVRLIAADFDAFYAGTARPADLVMERLRQITPQVSIDPQKAVLLHALVDYFSPQRGVYEYRDSSSFGRLLRNPRHEKLVGDCNQILTLYIFLYSRYYPVQDLQVRSLPEHVALHCAGIDIETTNSSFVDYSGKPDNLLVPVEEIVSINLLDTTDAYLATHEVAPQDFLQASRFATILSHNHAIARQNLHVAYRRLVQLLMQRSNYKQALKFARASRDHELIGVVSHNGAVYEMERHNYAAARRYAASAPRREMLVQNSWQAEGAYKYEAHQYHEAIKAFKRAGNQALVRQSYEALFFKEQEHLDSGVTTETIKAHAKTIKRLHIYAQKSGNKKLIEHAHNLKKYL